MKQGGSQVSESQDTYDDLDELRAEDILGLNSNNKIGNSNKKRSGLRPRGRFNANARCPC